MFGTLRPLPCTLADADQQQFRRFYCGLCKAVGDDHGQLARGMTGYDAIFLAILADALVDEAAAPSSCRCPMMPVIHRPTVDARSPALRFAASMQVLLADQFLADRAVDGRRAFRALRGFLSGKVRRARSVLSEHGVDTEDLSGFELEQAAREIPGVTGPLAASEPTARALSGVFVRVVHLPGASHRLRSGACRRDLEALGAAVGRLIYLTDALEDLRKDFLRGDFNPCLSLVQGRLAPDAKRVALCRRQIAEDAATLALALRDLPLLRHRDLLRNILVEQLAGRARAALRVADGWVGPGRAVLVEYREAPAIRKFHMAFLMVMASLLAWVGQVFPALAQPKPPRLPRPPAGAKDAGPTDAGLPEVCPDGGLDGGVDGGLPERCRELAKGDGGLIDGGSGVAQGTLDAGADAGAGPTFPSSGSDPCGCVCCFKLCCKEPFYNLCQKPCGSGTSVCDDLGSCGKGCCDCGKGCDPSSFCKKGCDPQSCCNGCADSACKGCCNSCDPGSCCKGCDPGSCCKGCDLNGCCHGCKCSEAPPLDGCS